ncbi:MAG TPA: peptide chain release factor 3 [Elusimicrobiota bacterium]|nr:peptide chain release factor 3 [Elusimicrobiota bacterium]
MTNQERMLRRRTLAIISHPDAGKTTLTEKLLLYGGAVQLAGSVTARKKERSTTSDWMELEKKRGISVNSTVLQFEYGGFHINLLDTPGHKDFSEDTYRVLTAADAVIMVLDAAKGIESQTLKLFEFCRLRQIPIFTFINKFDRPSMDPLALLDEIDRSLQLQPYPMNWPLGTGADFKGIFDRRAKQMHFFERVPGGAFLAPVAVLDRLDDQAAARVKANVLRRAIDELAVLDQAGERFDPAAVKAGDMTPVFFGSAANNFGIQLLLDGFLELSSPPRPQPTATGMILPEDPRFSGFVFKIQSNMDPRHRDQLAFVRVCSGRFERDMRVLHARTGETIRLASSHKVLGRERETVDEAFAGDIVGIVGHSQFHIGDTLTVDKSIAYKGIPQFPPEHLAYLHGASAADFKRFRTGLAHLLQEGVVQTFALRGASSRVPLLGAVGPLQFEVLAHRLQSEYGAASRLEPSPWTVVRWAGDSSPAALNEDILPSGARLAEDADGRLVVLFVKEWDCKYFLERHPKIALSKLPPGSGTAVPV